MKLNEYKILDNFVPDLLFKFYYDYVNDPSFSWHYIHNISEDKFIQGSPNFGFWANALPSHENIFSAAQSEPSGQLFFPLLLMIQEECGGKNILRARFDMTTKTPTLLVHGPHVDTDVPNIAGILYLNESDGDTVLFNQKGENGKIPEGIDLTIKKTISPKVNRLLLFDGALIHTGHSPVNYSNRILLNMNFGRK